MITFDNIEIVKTDYENETILTTSSGRSFIRKVFIGWKNKKLIYGIDDFVECFKEIDKKIDLRIKELIISNLTDITLKLFFKVDDFTISKNSIGYNLPILSLLIAQEIKIRNFTPYIKEGLGYYDLRILKTKYDNSKCNITNIEKDPLTF